MIVGGILLSVTAIPPQTRRFLREAEIQIRPMFFFFVHKLVQGLWMTPLTGVTGNSPP